MPMVHEIVNSANSGHQIEPEEDMISCIVKQRDQENNIKAPIITITSLHDAKVSKLLDINYS